MGRVKTGDKKKAYGWGKGGRVKGGNKGKG